jgi:hypothetical protein
MSELDRLQTAAPITITDGSASLEAVVKTGTPLNTDPGLVVKEGTRGQSASSNSIPVVIANDQQISRGSLVNGQATVTTVSANLSSNNIKLSLTIKASNDNTSTVYVGSDGSVASNSGFELGPGESVSVPVQNTNLIYLIASAGSQKISYIGV